MVVIETYTKRQKRLAKAGQSDVYSYDELPQRLRVQIVHILVDAFGTLQNRSRLDGFEACRSNWRIVHDLTAREVGLFHLGQPYEDEERQCCEFSINTDTNDALDFIQIAFQWVHIRIRNASESVRESMGCRVNAEQAIDELNRRFDESLIGYAFADGILIRKDEEFLHRYATLPCLQLLNSLEFEGASEEFTRAHAHYSARRNGEAINEALKAFESTMRSICDDMAWNVAENAISKELLDALFEQRFIPPQLRSQFTSLRSVLESGLPVVRNRFSGHGQGKRRRRVPAHFAGYALNLAASNITFLLQSYCELLKKKKVGTSH